ncbi:MAG: RNA polymerase sigma factor [Ferruginibacter sp.]
MRNFSEVVINNSDALKSFAFTLTKDSEDARDLMQETMYRALANNEKYRTGTNIKAWMYTIMRNIFINDYRRKSRNRLVLDNSGNDLYLNHQRSSVPNMADTNIRLKEIKEALYNIPKIFSEPFILYFEGFKYNEIAALMNEPLGTIKSRIHFARKLLKEKLVRYE